MQEWGTGARSWCLNRSSAGSGARERRCMGAAGRSRGVQREGEGCRHVLPEHPWRGGRGRLEVEGGSGLNNRKPIEQQKYVILNS